jgi:hypothetical protein
MLRTACMVPWALMCTSFFTNSALAADCEFADPGKVFSVSGAVLHVGAANDLVADMGFRKVVAVKDRQLGCVAYVQVRRASGCAKGKTAAAKGRTFGIAFTPVVLLGADSVKCR